jgi:uncharacterized membrane protein YkoI
MTKRSRNALLVTGAVAALAGGGAAIAGATGGGDDEETQKPITGSALDQAKAAALAHTGGGRVTETEAGDEEGAYEVEVTRDDGSQVDVHLDDSFHVLGTKADHEDDGEE